MNDKVGTPRRCGWLVPFSSQVCAVEAELLLSEFVRIFLVDARECKIGEPLSGVDVERGRGRGVLSTHLTTRET